MDEEEWRVVPVFETYEVSDAGRIRNIKTERVLRPTFTPQGHHKVNLSRNGAIFTRHVSQLVAKAFLPLSPREDFTSLIHLDGDKTNCRPDNLAWRNRGFALRYHAQFDSSNWRTSKLAVMEMKTREEFGYIQHACVAYGLLFDDVLVSAHERTYVFPTFQEFRFLEDV